MSQLIKIIRKNSELSEVETENNVAISQFIASACFFITTFIILTTYFSSTSHPLIIQACNVVFTCLYGLSYFILKKTYNYTLYKDNKLNINRWFKNITKHLKY